MRQSKIIVVVKSGSYAIPVKYAYQSPISQEKLYKEYWGIK